MNSPTRTDELLEELDEQEICFPVADEDAAVPKLCCDAEAHNHEPIREGEQAVAVLARTPAAGWQVEKTVCSQCTVLEEVSAMDEAEATAVVEGVVYPENDFGPSTQAYLLDGFLWELYEEPV